MSTETEKIKSIREALAGGYKKPDPTEVEKYVTQLKESEDARNYLKVTRGLSEDTISHFKLGYCSDRNAISIPVYKGDELVNIRYRSLDPNAKAKYTQERGCEVWLYNDNGIEKGKEKKGVLVVEGEFDLMSAWQAGFKNVVSPASGKDSYGVWLELLDAIPRVYIAYDNDKPGKQSSLDLAERVGVDKSFEVLYPEGFKDANEYFLKHTADDFRELIKISTPYYKHKFSGVGDVIDSLMGEQDDAIELDMIPYVKWEEDWVGVFSGDSNVGKTTYAVNIAEELASKGIASLILPFERGIKSVGQRFLQVRYRKQKEDFGVMAQTEWDHMKEDAVSLPVYFSMPNEGEVADIISRARRLFNVKFVIVDHLDYFIRGNDKVSKQADMMYKFKTIAQENNINFIVVHHISKQKGRKNKRPTKEDLKGASDIYQIAEVVALLHKPHDGMIEVIIDKNKGPMGKRQFSVDMTTGKFTNPVDVSVEELEQMEKDNEKW